MKRKNIYIVNSQRKERKYACPMYMQTNYNVITDLSIYGNPLRFHIICPRSKRETFPCVIPMNPFFGLRDSESSC